MQKKLLLVTGYWFYELVNIAVNYLDVRKSAPCSRTVCNVELRITSVYLRHIEYFRWWTEHTLLMSSIPADWKSQFSIWSEGISEIESHLHISGLPILLPEVKEAVLLGAAILGACASGDFASIRVWNQLNPTLPISNHSINWSVGVDITVAVVISV